ncbi:MAG TPA: hypothetical protein VGC76_07610 [Pyrinomonadaceae bacterium]|jgi:hypothetical protein
METSQPTSIERTSLLPIILAGVLVGLIILIVMVLAVTGLIIMLSGGVTQGFSGSWPKLGVSAAILIGAIGLYAVKESRGQILYGLGEMAVGLVANWRSLDAFMPENEVPTNALFVRLTILAGGLYLIVRGITNVVDGVRKIFPISWAELRGVFKKGYNEPTDVRVPRLLKQFWLETWRARASAITLEFQDSNHSTRKRTGKISGVGKTTFQISWEDGSSQDFSYNVPTTEEGTNLRLVYPSGDVVLIPLPRRTTH